jgi:hypothetical protein
MPRTLYTPRLSDDVIRLLYREGQRRRIPMTRLADELLRDSLARLTPASFPESRAVREEPAYPGPKEAA